MLRGWGAATADLCRLLLIFYRVGHTANMNSCSKLLSRSRPSNGFGKINLFKLNRPMKALPRGQRGYWQHQLCWTHEAWRGLPWTWWQCSIPSPCTRMPFSSWRSVGKQWRRSSSTCWKIKGGATIVRDFFAINIVQRCARQLQPKIQTKITFSAEV